MAKKQWKFKLTALERCGSITDFHTRMEQNGKSIKLQRIYDIIGGFKKATHDEKILFSRFLQTPISELFTE